MVTPVTGGGGRDLGPQGDSVTVTKQYLVGDWNQAGNTLSFSKTGVVSWADKATGKTLTGKWELAGVKLVLSIRNLPINDANGKGDFIVSDAYAGSFTMQLNSLTKEFYQLERK